MDRGDDNPSPHSPSSPFQNSHNCSYSSSSSSDSNSSRFRFGLDSSFSTSGSISASTSTTPAINQPDRNSKMFFPIDIETRWYDGSLTSLLFSSQYSPLNLGHLSQPVPRDAPADMDVSIFTFEDAFEDLLAASQDQPLPSIAARYEQRKLLRSMFPDGEPSFFRLRRLKSQGYLEMPDRNQLIRQAESNWDQFHKELDRRASNVWRAVTGEDDRNSRDVYEDADNFPESFRERSESPRQRRRDPDHFDDFFSSIRSSFSEEQSSWDNFVKSFHDSPRDRCQTEKHDKNQEVIKDEYVDRFGYLHSKVTVKTLDEDGNQIGSQTNYTVRPAEKQEGEAKHDAEDTSGIRASGKVETKAGWFWK